MVSRLMHACALLLVILLATLPAGNLFGQANDGNLVGSVLDPTGLVVANATLEVENTGTGVKTTTKTDDAGFYRVNNLLVGTYKVTASATGMTAATREVKVELNRTTTANITLAVSGVVTEVSVTEAPPLIDTTTAFVSNNYATQLVANLPLAANPVAGGVYNLSLTGAGVASSGGIGVGFGPSVGGQRPRNNNFMVEGADNNRKDITGTVVDLPVDSIKEFSVQQNQFSAEFGHSSGGQFNVVLQGGENEFHGTAYEYFQNRKLNAVDQAEKRQAPAGQPFQKARFDQSIVGASFGGPIKKNKMFFFGDFDYNPIGQQSTPSAVRRAPTAAGYAMLDSIPGLSATNLGILKQYVPPAPAQTQTTAVTGSDGVVRNVPIGTFQILAPNYQNTYKWLGSVDFTQSDRDQWRGRYVGNRIDFIDNVANLPAFFLPRPVRQMLISVSQFHTFSATMTNELRLGYNRYTSDVPAGDFKFPGLDQFPNLLFQQDLNLQIGPNQNAPQATKQNTYQLSENLTWFRNSHELKFGFDGRDLIACSCPAFIQRVRGDYDYSTIDRFLRDLSPNVLSQRSVGGRIYNGNSYQLFFYGNDNWKVNPNLTVNLGLRYEFTSVPTSMKEFELNSIADVPGVITFRAPQPQKNNFAPRIGFAYSPGNSAATSIRGGFGIAYDLIFDNVGTNARPPQAFSTIDETNLVDQNQNPVTNYLKNGGIRPDSLPPAVTPLAARQATSAYLPDQKLGYSINWNLGVQRSFGKDYTAEIRYLGNRGVHLLFQTQLNRNAIVTPTHNLPLFYSQPSQATLDALPLTLAQLTAERSSALGNPWLPYGFTLPITSYAPLGNSQYHGLALDVNKRFSNHVLFKAAYTWSHLMDDSTAEVNSTALSPRRPEDFNNIRNEWASSALDRRHRVSFAWDYQAPWFENSSNVVLRKVVGNWQFSGAWIYESPEFATPQSGLDANLNNDSAADRVVLNLAGDPNVSSDITPVNNSAGQTVGYRVTNPNAYYIRANLGVYTTAGRNILEMRPIDNFDMSVAKILPVTERYKAEIRLDMYNAFNHPQYTPGRPNRVSSFNHAGETNYLTPGNSVFAKWDEVMPSNARQLQLTAKFRF